MDAQTVCGKCGHPMHWIGCFAPMPTEHHWTEECRCRNDVSEFVSGRAATHPSEDLASAAESCSFGPSREPFYCRIHGDVRLTLHDEQCRSNDAKQRRRLGPSWRESMAYEQGFEDGQRAARAAALAEVRAAVEAEYERIERRRGLGDLALAEDQAASVFAVIALLETSVPTPIVSG